MRPLPPDTCQELQILVLGMMQSSEILHVRAVLNMRFGELVNQGLENRICKTYRQWQCRRDKTSPEPICKPKPPQPSFISED